MSRQANFSSFFTVVMTISVVLWYKYFSKASVRLRRKLGTWMLMACLVFQRHCFHHSLLCWKIDKFHHCQMEYKSPHSHSWMCKILDKGTILPSFFLYGSHPPVSPPTVGVCRNSYYDIFLPEMTFLSSPCSNLIYTPFYRIRLAVSLNFTVWQNKKERDTPVIFSETTSRTEARCQQDEATASPLYYII